MGNLDAMWAKVENIETDRKTERDKQLFYQGAVATCDLLRTALRAVLQDKNPKDVNPEDAAMCLMGCMVEITKCTDAFGHEMLNDITNNLAKDADTAETMEMRAKLAEFKNSLRKP